MNSESEIIITCYSVTVNGELQTHSLYYLDEKTLERVALGRSGTKIATHLLTFLALLLDFLNPSSRVD